MINYISGISVAGVTIGTMALIVVLSVFNGFESLVVSLFNSFDPQIKVSPVRGKTFEADSYPWAEISALKGVQHQTAVIEEKALLRYGKAQFLATLKGVDSSYTEWTGLDTMLTAGSLILEFKDQPFAIVGQGVAYYLGLNPDDYNSFIEAYAPRRTSSIGANPENAFNRSDIRASGIFSVQQDFDTKYVIVPLDFMKELFEYNNELTSIELSLEPTADTEALQEKISHIAGTEFQVKNRLQQQETLYRIMHSEKWAIFLILSFILLIATFNVIGTLSMLVLDKKKDIAVLRSLGAGSRLIRAIFLTEGLLVSLSGALAGLLLGAMICVLQQQFGIVKINAEGGSFLINAYPVLMKFTDFLYVFLTVSCIGLIAAVIPVLSLNRINHERISLSSY